MPFVDLALDLTDDRFDRIAGDPWFRDALLAELETRKVRVEPGATLAWLDGLSDLAIRLGWVVGQDESGYYALPEYAANLDRRLHVSEARATSLHRALGEQLTT